MASRLEREVQLLQRVLKALKAGDTASAETLLQEYRGIIP